MLGTVAFTQSRTGYIAIALCSAWGILDRQLPKAIRWRLISLFPLLGVMILTLPILSNSLAGLPLLTPTGPVRSGDISSSRFAIWANTWELIKTHPWTGVGWDNFNFAWTLTPMAGRPPAFFDHTHNLPLHLIVTLGVPLGLLAFAALLGLFGMSARRAWKTEGPELTQDEVMRRAAVMMLVVIGWHSMLEYPLWYWYFQLIAVWAFCVAMGWQGSDVLALLRRSARWRVAAVMGVLVAGSVGLKAWVDHQTVDAIYHPKANAGPLSERMAKGQQAWFWVQKADYAVATTFTPQRGQPWPADVALAFERGTHRLLDTRLMMAWARALEARGAEGDLDKARHLVDRLREFKNPMSREWLDECDAFGAEVAPDAKPWHCTPPSRRMDWRDFE